MSLMTYFCLKVLFLLSFSNPIHLSLFKSPGSKPVLCYSNYGVKITGLSLNTNTGQAVICKQQGRAVFNMQLPVTQNAQCCKLQ